MRFPILSSLLLSSLLVCATTAQQVRDTEIDVRDKTIVDALSQNHRTILASQHLQIPLFNPLRQLLDEKSQTWTVFVPSNAAIRDELNRVDEIWCENGEMVRADGRFRRVVKKEMAKEILGRKEWRKLPQMTDEDCENLSRLIALDEKVQRDARRLRVADVDHKTQNEQLKSILRQTGDEFRNIRFSAPVEKLLLAKSAYVVVPGRVDVGAVETNVKKSFDTLLSRPDIVPLDGYVSNTKLVLKKGSEGGLSLQFASPRAPVWQVDLDDRPIEAVNGLIYMTRHSIPCPHGLSKALMYNKLSLTQALLNYTGLLDQLDEQKSITVIAPTDSAWLRVLPRMLDKSTIRRMARQVRQRHNLMKKIFRRIKRQEDEEEDEEREERIRRYAGEEEGSAEPEYIRIRLMESELKPEEVETEEEAEPVEEMSTEEGEFESSQTRRFTRLGKQDIRSLLMSHIIPGVHFSDEMTQFNKITAMSGANLRVKADAATDKFSIGNSRTLFTDIPIKNGALHIVDDITTPVERFGLKFARRHHF